MTTNDSVTASIAAALLIFRLVVGLGLAVHGAQKVFGWFGSPGRLATAQGFEALGFRPGAFFALSAGLGELGGGVLTALGFLGAVGPALIVMVILVAGIAVHLKNGFLSTNNGWELSGLYVASGLLLALIGFGPYSLDNAIGFTMLSGPKIAGVLVLAAVVLAFLNLAMRRPVQTTAP